MAILKEIVATTGTYTDSQGNEKKRYTKLGVAMSTRNGGEMIKIESIPIGWDGWAYLNDPKPRDNASQGQQGGNDSAPFSDSDIPF